MTLEIRQILRRILNVLASPSLVLLFHQAVWSTPVPRMVHYEGYLEKNGIPCDSANSSTTCGNVKAIFTLELEGAGNTSFVYPVPNLALVSGRFVVDIGENQTVPDWVFDNPGKVCLKATINDVPLQGCQKITPVPYAVRADEANDFHVKNNLKVNSSIVVTGSTTVSGNAIINNGGILDFQNSPRNAHYFLWAGDNSLRFYRDWNEYPPPFMITGKNSYFSGDVNVTGKVTAGLASFNGPIYIHGKSLPYECEWTINNVEGRNVRGLNAACMAGKHVVAGGCSSENAAITTSCAGFTLNGGLRCATPGNVITTQWICKFNSDSNITRAQALCCY